LGTTVGDGPLVGGDVSTLGGPAGSGRVCACSPLVLAVAGGWAGAFDGAGSLVTPADGPAASGCALALGSVVPCGPIRAPNAAPGVARVPSTPPTGGMATTPTNASAEIETRRPARAMGPRRVAAAFVAAAFVAAAFVAMP
jgi:hypothetical protein